MKLVLGLFVVAAAVAHVAGDCVSMAQALNDNNSACRKAGGQGSFSKTATYVMAQTCENLREELWCKNSYPSTQCCADLIKFIEAGCSCEKNLRDLAHAFAGTDLLTFYAIGRVAQIDCGYGKVFDPCSKSYGTCDKEFTACPAKP